jgi:hypothetical protein
MNDKSKEMKLPTFKNDPEIYRAIEMGNLQKIQALIKAWEEVLMQTSHKIEDLKGFGKIIGGLEKKLEEELKVNQAGAEMISRILIDLEQLEVHLQERVEKASSFSKN